MSGMNYATKLVNFPQQIFAAAIATVIFPLLAAQFARDNRHGVARSVVIGLRLVNFITIPSVCALIVLAHPMVQALFERGTFQASATDLTAGLLPFSALGLVALAANVVLTRCCFACKETLWPVTISVGTVVVNVLLSLVWLPTLGARGLLLANSVSQIMQAVLLLMLIARLVPGIDWGALVVSTAQDRAQLARDVRGAALDRRARRHARTDARVARVVPLRADRHRRDDLRRGRAHARRRRTRACPTHHRRQVRAQRHEPAGKPRSADRMKITAKFRF